MSIQVLNGSNYKPEYQSIRQTNFSGSNPLLRNKQKIDEFELERNLDTKEGKLAFLIYHLEKAKNSQGFIARGFNKLKGLTGIGLSSKKLDAEIAAFINDEIPFEKVCEDIAKFQYNQKEATEILVDTASAAISFTASHALTNFSGFSSCLKRKSCDKKTLSNAILGAVLGGGFKAWTKLFDSFGIEKSQRKENRHFFKDMLTGSVAGVSSAIPGLVGTQPIPMIGSVMAGMTLNSGIRYWTLSKEDKSFGDFCRQQIENPGIKLFATAALGTLAACNYKNLSEWEKVAEKSKKKIEDLKPFSSEDMQTSFETLAGTKGINVFDTSKENSIGSIIQKCETGHKNASETLAMLEQKNMFYPKYLQTLPNNFADTKAGETLCKELPMLPKIIELVKSECTGARTEHDAQIHINELFGDGKYTIIKPKDKNGNELEAKPLGVGSVAETWLIKDKDNKEYVVKMVKPGVSKTNLEKQKKDIESQIKGTDEQANANRKCLENLFNTWKKELDLKLESEAAITLANGVQHAHVVKPIETCQDGTAYVMEKAPGQLFSDYLAFEDLKSSMGIDNGSNVKRRTNIVSSYTNLYFEQIFSVPRKGEKVMHADPHPGNIFVSTDDKGQTIFTFIDTGNVIRMSNKEAVQNLYAHLNYFIGNTEGIATNLLKGAKYPEGIDENKAIKELKQELDTKFYNDHTYFEKGIENIFSLFNTVDTIAQNWMEKNKIISNPDNTNMHKSEYTYLQNYEALEGTNIHHIIWNTLREKKENEPITDEMKKQLIPLYKSEYERIFKEIKNIDKLINEKSSFECLKSKVLFNKYFYTIKILNAISTCGDDNFVKKAFNELNEKVNEIYTNIHAYNEEIKDSKSKELAEKSYNMFYNTFSEIKKATDVKDIEYYGNKKENTDNLYLEGLYEFKPEYQKTLEEIQQQSNELDDKRHKERIEDTKDMLDELNHPIDMAINRLSPTIKSIFSSYVFHPFNSTHEVVQLKKYLDKNKEHVINTLNLLIYGPNLGKDAKERKRTF